MVHGPHWQGDHLQEGLCLGRGPPFLLERAGPSIAEYIARRQRTVAEYVATRPIFDLVMEEERQRGTPAATRWWEQFIDFEAILDELEQREE